MNSLSLAAQPSFMHAIAWALIHFLWQGALIAVACQALRLLLKSSAPNSRYLVGCGALAVMVLAPVVTALRLTLKPVRPPLATSAGAVEVREENALPRFAVLKELPVEAPIEITTHLQKQRMSLEFWLPWLVAAWAVGVAVLSARLLFGWGALRRIRRLATEHFDEAWPHRIVELKRRLGVQRAVRVFQSAWIEVPAVVGWLRPVILFPASALSGLSPAQLESILAHELAHIRRHDPLVNLLQNVVETLLFYHPAVWWISRQMREERELCCDDLVLEVCGDRLSYASALASLEGMRATNANLALAARGGSLLRRIRRLAEVPPATIQSWPSWAAGTLTVLILTGLVILQGNFVRTNAQANPVANPKESQPTSEVGNLPKANSAAESASRLGVEDLIGEARQLLESGDVDAAEKKLREALQHSGNDSRASYYLQVIRERRNLRELDASRRQMLEVEATARQASLNSRIQAATDTSTLQFLESIQIQEIHYDDLPLSEVVKDLEVRSQRGDPQGKGLRFVIDPHKTEPGIDPVTGAVIPTPDDIRHVRIRLTLRDVSLHQIIEAVRLEAGQPVKISIEPNLIRFSSAVPQLFHRTFRLNPRAVHRLADEDRKQNIEDTGSDARPQIHPSDHTILNAALVRLFAKAGIPLESRPLQKTGDIPVHRFAGPALFHDGSKTLAFNDRLGLLFVRATLEDLDTIEKVIQALNQVPPQIQFEVRFAELAASDLKALSLDWISRGVMDGSAGPGKASSDFENVFPSTPVVLNEAKFGVALRNLEEQKGVAVLTAPRVTTVSGRQAVINLAEKRQILFPSADVAQTIGYHLLGLKSSFARVPDKDAPVVRVDDAGDLSGMHEIPLGPRLDGITVVKPDGRSLELNFTAKIVDWLGYIDPSTFEPIKDAVDSDPALAIPLPVIITRQVSTSVELQDGETAVVEIPVKHRGLAPPQTPKQKNAPTDKRVLVFVTPTIIDPAGNRVNPPAQ